MQVVKDPEVKKMLAGESITARAEDEEIELIDLVASRQHTLHFLRHSTCLCHLGPQITSVTLVLLMGSGNSSSVTPPGAASGLCTLIARATLRSTTCCTRANTCISWSEAQHLALA